MSKIDEPFVMVGVKFGSKITNQTATGSRSATKVSFLKRLSWGRMFVRVLVVAVSSGEIANASDLKPGPHGIYALLPSFNSERRVNLDRPVWSNPIMQGVCVREVWRKIQPQASSYDWSYFDEATALAARNGKGVGLEVPAGIFTPEWVYQAGAARFEFTLKGPWRPTEHNTMPEPWDTEFLEKWGAMVRAMGQRYDRNHAVAYVIMGGLGFSIESFYVKTPEDIAKLQSMGGLTRWLEGAKRVVDLYAQAFPTTPFFYAMAPPIGKDFTGTRELVEYGVGKYPGRFGIMFCGLNASAEASYYPNHAVEMYSSKAPAGFEMVWNTEGDEGAKRVKGSLRQALARAVEFKAHFVQVYEVDCQNPVYADELREARQRLAHQNGNRHDEQGDR